MPLCHQATGHYLSRCWPRSMSPYGDYRFWVKVAEILLPLTNSRVGHMESWTETNLVLTEAFFNSISIYIGTTTHRCKLAVPVYMGQYFAELGRTGNNSSISQHNFMNVVGNVELIFYHIEATHWGHNKMAAIFQMTFSNAFSCDNVWILIKIPLKFVPKVSMNNIPALVQVMAWDQPAGGKPLSESVMKSLVAHIWVTLPQWVSVHIWSS